MLSVGGIITIVKGIPTGIGTVPEGMDRSLKIVRHDQFISFGRKGVGFSFFFHIFILGVRGFVICIEGDDAILTFSTDLRRQALFFSLFDLIWMLVGSDSLPLPPLDHMMQSWNTSTDSRPPGEGGVLGFVFDHFFLFFNCSGTAGLSGWCRFFTFRIHEILVLTWIYNRFRILTHTSERNVWSIIILEQSKRSTMKAKK